MAATHRQPRAGQRPRDEESSWGRLLWLTCQSCGKRLGKYDPVMRRIVVESGAEVLHVLPGSARRCRCGAWTVLRPPADTTDVA